MCYGREIILFLFSCFQYYIKHSILHYVLRKGNYFMPLQLFSIL